MEPMRDDAAPDGPVAGIGARCARGRRARAVLSGCALLVVACLTPVGDAHARGLAIGLNWTRGQGAEQCIGPIELARSLEARLGRALFEPAGTAELALEARVERNPEDGSFHARLAVVDEHGLELGSRELSAPGPDCRALDEALTLVIAVTLYPEGGLGGFGIALPSDVAGLLGDALAALEKEAPPPVAVAPAVAPPATPAQAIEPSTREPRTPIAQGWQVRIGGAGLLRAGASPAATLGAQLALGIAPPGWPLLELTAGVLSEDRSGFSIDGSSGELHVSASRFGLSLCPEALQGALELRGCLGGEALVASASTDGLRQDGKLSVIVPAFSLGVRGALWLAPSFALGAGIGLSAPLRRPDLRVQTRSGQDRTVFQQPSVGAELSLGLIWRAAQ